MSHRLKVAARAYFIASIIGGGPDEVEAYSDQRGQRVKVPYRLTAEEDFAVFDLSPAFRHVIFDHI